MNKHEFLAALRRELTALPHDELTEQLNFYNEMIDDRMEEGMTEEEAVSGIGTVQAVSAQILSNANVPTPSAPSAPDPTVLDPTAPDPTVKEEEPTAEPAPQIKNQQQDTENHSESKEGMRWWVILLLILGAPLWIPLVVAVAAVVLSLYVTLWAVVGSLWAIPASLAACALTGCLGTIPLLLSGKWIAALLLCGIGLASGGLAIFAVFGCAAVTKGAAQLTKLGCKGIKALFTSRRKGNES